MIISQAFGPLVKIRIFKVRLRRLRDKILSPSTYSKNVVGCFRKLKEKSSRKFLESYLQNELKS